MPLHSAAHAGIKTHWRSLRGRRGVVAPLVLLLCAVGHASLEQFSWMFVSAPSSKSPTAGRRGLVQVAASASEVDSDKKVDDVLRSRLSEKGEAADEGAGDDEEDRSWGSPKPVTRQAKRALAKKTPKSRKIVKKSLDEVLKAADDDTDRPNWLPARRDVYSEVGITQQEVEQYFSRREETASNFFDKVSVPTYTIFGLSLAAVTYSAIDAFLHPSNDPVTASMVGTG
eukprot:TRINITY_DN14436_c0_g1_i1.p1 TRINITY_DN14436_c0_g1~~TRINITY_DN14436_c0_g1_i1.p1  ORF type:complete len:228 (+),score=45.96 TRINITY_DN14436_c0_g1_i1:73-756(+)